MSKINEDRVTPRLLFYNNRSKKYECRSVGNFNWTFSAHQNKSKVIGYVEAYKGYPIDSKKNKGEMLAYLHSLDAVQKLALFEEVKA